MKNKVRMAKARKGKTAVVPAVFIMLTAVVAALAGCQNASQEEAKVMSESVAAEITELQPEAASQAEAPLSGQSSIQTEPERSDIQTGQGQNDTQEQLLQSGQSNPQGLPSGAGIQGGQADEAAKEPPAGWELTLSSEDWGLSFGEPGTKPAGNAKAEDLAWYDAYYVGEDSEKVIYLTFDCGYENGNTEPILDALKKHHVQATFFVVGHFLETAPDLVKRMTQEGHAVGNHTYHHLDMPTISDEETFRKEMDDVAELFHEITGEELSPYYRPPQGKCNVDNLKMAQKLGYHTIFWSLAYVDWNQDQQPSHDEAFDKLTTRIHPGAVVLLHNTSSTNGEILDELLTKWEEMGYTFRPLSELTGV